MRKIITVSVYDKTLEKLDSICVVSGMTRSECVRACINSVYKELQNRGYIKKGVKNNA